MASGDVESKMALNPFQVVMKQCGFTLGVTAKVQCDGAVVTVERLAEIVEKVKLAHSYLQVVLNSSKDGFVDATHPVPIRVVHEETNWEEEVEKKTRDGLDVEKSMFEVQVLVQRTTSSDWSGYVQVFVDHIVADARAAFVIARDVLRGIGEPEMVLEKDEGLVNWFGRLGSVESEKREAEPVLEMEKWKSDWEREEGKELFDDRETYVHVQSVLSREVSERLRLRAREESASVWSVLQAAWSMTEALRTDSDKIVAKCIIDTRRFLDPPLPSAYVCTPGSIAVASSPIDESKTIWEIAKNLKQTLDTDISKRHPIERLKTMDLRVNACMPLNNYGVVPIETHYGNLKIQSVHCLVNDQLPKTIKTAAAGIAWSFGGKLHIQSVFFAMYWRIDTMHLFVQTVTALLQAACTDNPTLKDTQTLQDTILSSSPSTTKKRIVY